jgi:hypothetical protein
VEVGWALRQCKRRVKFDRNCRVGYLVVGWALRPFNRIIGGINLTVFRLGLEDVVWALRPCNRRDKFDSVSRLG